MTGNGRYECRAEIENPLPIQGRMRRPAIIGFVLIFAWRFEHALAAVHIQRLRRDWRMKKSGKHQANRQRVLWLEYAAPVSVVHINWRWCTFCLGARAFHRQICNFTCAS